MFRTDIDLDDGQTGNGTLYAARSPDGVHWYVERIDANGFGATPAFDGAGPARDRLPRARRHDGRRRGAARAPLRRQLAHRDARPHHLPAGRRARPTPPASGSRSTATWRSRSPTSIPAAIRCGSSARTPTRSASAPCPPRRRAPRSRSAPTARSAWSAPGWPARTRGCGSRPAASAARRGPSRRWASRSARPSSPASRTAPRSWPSAIAAAPSWPCPARRKYHSSLIARAARYSASSPFNGGLRRGALEPGRHRRRPGRERRAARVRRDRVLARASGAGARKRVPLWVCDACLPPSLRLRRPAGRALGGARHRRRRRITSPTSADDTPDSRDSAWTDVSVPGVPRSPTRSSAPRRGLGMPDAATGRLRTCSAADDRHALSFDDSGRSRRPVLLLVEADDGLTGPADSDPVAVTLDTDASRHHAVTQRGGTVASRVHRERDRDGQSACRSRCPPTASPYPYVGHGAHAGGLRSSRPVSVIFTAPCDAAGNLSHPRSTPSGLVWDQTRPPAPGPRGRHRSVAAEGDAQLGFRDQRRRARACLPPAHEGPDRIAGRRVPQARLARLQQTFRSTRPTSTRSTRPTPAATSGPSVRLVRLNDATPPSMPIVASPRFIPSRKCVTLSVGPEHRQHPGRPLRDPPQRRPARRHRRDRLHRPVAAAARRSSATSCAPSTPTATTTDSGARDDHDAGLDAADRARADAHRRRARP